MKTGRASWPDNSAAFAASLAHSGEPKTLSVPEAGKVYFNLGRNGSYAAARRGEITVVRVGHRLRAPVVTLEHMLEQVGQEPMHLPVDLPRRPESHSSAPRQSAGEPKRLTEEETRRSPQLTRPRVLPLSCRARAPKQKSRRERAKVKVRTSTAKRRCDR